MRSKPAKIFRQFHHIILLMGLPNAGTNTLHLASPYQEVLFTCSLYTLYTDNNNLLVKCHAVLFNENNLTIHSDWLTLQQGLHKKSVLWILTLSVEQLINDQRFFLQNQFQSLLKNFLNTINPKESNWFFVLTQLDNLIGFVDYFVNEETKKNSLGLMISENFTHPLLLEKWDKAFHQFIKNMNDNLIQNLEQSITRTQRGMVKEFPIQLESLRKPIASLIQIFASTITQPAHYLGGIYFTSCAQSTASIDRLSQILEKRFSLHNPTHSANLISSHNYFVTGIWQEINYFIHLTIKPKKKYSRHLLSILLSLLLLSYSSYLGYGYYHYLQWFNQTKTTLIEINYLLSSQNNSSALLIALQKLKTLETNPVTKPILQPQQKTFAIHALHTIYIKNLHYSLATIFHQQLKTLLAENSHPSTLYKILKAYLMLADPQHYHPYYLAHTLLSTTKLDPTFLPTLINDLQLNPPKLKLDTLIIKQARENLLSLPSQTLALTKLPSYAVTLTTTTLQLNHHVIPVYYQKNYLPKFYYEIIPLIVKENLAGDWVLGQSKITPYALNNQLEKLSNNLRAYYLQNYLTFWQKIITTYESIEFKNLTDTYEQLKDLTKSPEDLFYQWKIIRDNIMLIDHAPHTIINNDFVTIASFLEGEKNIIFIQTQLKTLNEYLKSLLDAENLAKAAYLLSKKRYAHTLTQDPWDKITEFSATLPEPFNHWLNNIVQQSWQIVVTHANDYSKVNSSDS